MMDFVTYLLKSSICISLFGIIYVIFLRKTTFLKFNRIYLISGLLLSFALPLYQYTYDIKITVPASGTDRASADLSLLPSIINLPEPTFDIGIWEILFAIALTGIFIQVLRNIRMFGNLLATIRKGKKFKQNGYSIIENTQIKTPFSFLGYILINPDLSDVERDSILKHEKAHISQKHWIDILCSQCALVLQWFNPMMWLYLYYQKENHEFLADKAVLDAGVSPSVYQAVLVNQRFQQQIFFFGNSFKSTNPINRLTMMEKTKTKPFCKITILILIPLFGIFFRVFAEPNYVMETENSTTEAIGVQYENDTDTIAMKKSSDYGYRNENKEVKTYDEIVGNFSENNLPLLRIDGREYSPTSNLSMLEIMKDAKKTGIYSISVLKDKTATDKYGEKGKNGVIEIETVGKEKTTVGNSSKNNLPLLRIDGREYSPTNNLSMLEIIEDTKKNGIYSISVLKDKTATDKYGEKGKHGVIEIQTVGSEKITAEKGANTSMRLGSGPLDYPLVVVDGKIVENIENFFSVEEFLDMTEEDLEKALSINIESITVWKGKSAVELYGEKAKDGVLDIKTIK